ncbi:HNH endonuclease signature motif containing protein [Erwinia sp. V90_4]|uniref:HNH endonuclease signature motif containing protein n=1 Tax=Erwinia sp. V90_4 TaxID=3044239 RepID=UPI00249DF9A3|nr:HNH endonuclease signature motif containing protein [Erwinia sp. V90_4]MDI3440360.1 HNH endonuclease signature motif containing protein [Erwinia sp. V90_4]
MKTLEKNGLTINVYSSGQIEIPEREITQMGKNSEYVRKIPTVTLTPVSNGKAGYFQVKVCNKRVEARYYVHRLVWEAFFGPIAEGYEIDHIDEDKSNNALENLTIVTRKQNMEKMRASKPHVIKNLWQNK